MTESQHVSTYDFRSLWKQLESLKLKKGGELSDYEVDALDWTGMVEKATDYPVGGGGFGDLYLAKWQGIPEEWETPPQVVIKDVRMIAGEYNNATLRKRKLQRLKHEVAVWQQVQHENILQFVGIVQFPGRLPSLLFPWMNFGNVKNYIASYPGADKMALQLGVAKGLKYLHEFSPRIVHGDMKAENVLVDGQGKPLLADFGLSKMMGDITAMTTGHTQAPGTTRWKAPEYYVKQFSVTPEGDVYAYGMTCLEIMTGRIPFHNRPTAVVMTAVVLQGEIPDKPPNILVPDDLWSLWVTCWAREPSDRPTIGDIYDTLTDLAINTDFDFTSPLESIAEFDEEGVYDFVAVEIPSSNYTQRSISIPGRPSPPTESDSQGSLSSSSRTGSAHVDLESEISSPYNYFAFWRMLGTSKLAYGDSRYLDWTGYLEKKEEYPLGVGLFADIYEGVWVNLPDTYATPPPVVIKVHRSHFDKDDETRRRLSREISIWSRLKHRNLHPFLGLATDWGPLPAIVSPFIKNGDAVIYLEAHPGLCRLPYLLGLACAIRYLHELKPAIVHGDIQATNLYIDDSGVPCLASYASSRFARPDADGTLSGARFHSWMAPELIVPLIHGNQPTNTIASDVYAFGITAVEIMTGEVPFEGYGKESDQLLQALTPPTMKPKAIPEDAISRRVETVLEEYWDTAVHVRTPRHHILKQMDAILADGESLPAIWQLLSLCWSDNPVIRPSMTNVVKQLTEIAIQNGVDYRSIAYG